MTRNGIADQNNDNIDDNSIKDDVKMTAIGCFLFLFIRLKHHTQINAVYYTIALCVRVSYSLTTISDTK